MSIFWISSLGNKSCTAWTTKAHKAIRVSGILLGCLLALSCGRDSKKSFRNRVDDRSRTTEKNSSGPGSQDSYAGESGDESMDAILNLVAQGEELIVVLRDDEVKDPEEGLEPKAFALNSVDMRKKKLAEGRKKLKKKKFDVLSDPAHQGVTVGQDFNNLPIFVASFSSTDDFMKLKDNPKVAKIVRNGEVRLEQADTTWNLDLIKRSDALSLGTSQGVLSPQYLGEGSAVAVIDGLVDYKKSVTTGDQSLAYFGEGCSAPIPNDKCSVVYEKNFLGDPGTPDAHGTNVAGIVLKVAPLAKILTLNVFNGSSTSTSTILNAINWAISNQLAYNIKALNLSLSSVNPDGSIKRFSASCPDSAFESALKRARAAGIIPAVASGNAGFVGALSEPACAPSALSVGALALDDQKRTREATYSNTANFLSVLAPGGDNGLLRGPKVCAAGICMAGTSMASPHVAGAVALLSAIYPEDQMNYLVARIRSGDLFMDPLYSPIGWKIPQLDLPKAISYAGCELFLASSALQVPAQGGTFEVRVTTGKNCNWTASSSDPSKVAITQTTGAGSGSVAFMVAKSTTPSAMASSTLTVSSTSESKSFTIQQLPDKERPLGTISINEGANSTNSRTIVVTSNAKDNIALASVCLSESGQTTGGTCTPYETTKTFKIASPRDGMKRIDAYFTDQVGNRSATVSDYITLDTTPPAEMTLFSAKPTSTTAVLKWAVPKKNYGLTHKLVLNEGRTSPAKQCANGIPVSSGTNLETMASALKPNTYYSFRLCAIDEAGNVSAGLVKSVRTTSP